MKNNYLFYVISSLILFLVFFSIPGASFNDLYVEKIQDTTKLSNYRNNRKDSADVIISPLFKGHDAEYFGQWVMSKLNYPLNLKVDEISGVVIVEFFIDTLGNLSIYKIKNHTYKEFEEEAIRVLRSAPKWTPAYKNGKRIKAKLTLPVIFRPN